MKTGWILISVIEVVYKYGNSRIWPWHLFVKWVSTLVSVTIILYLAFTSILIFSHCHSLSVCISETITYSQLFLVFPVCITKLLPTLMVIIRPSCKWKSWKQLRMFKNRLTGIVSTAGENWSNYIYSYVFLYVYMCEFIF